MKEKILNTSIELFGVNGFSETSIQDIVNTIGVTKGTFYYYFDSKEELLRQIHLNFIDSILERQQKILEDQSLNYKEKIHEIVGLIVKNIKIQGQSARIFFREMRNLKEEHLEVINEKRHQFRINLQELIQEGIEEEELRSDLRSDMLSFAILGITNWTYYWYNPEGSVPEEELINIYVDLILNGIKG